MKHIKYVMLTVGLLLFVDVLFAQSDLLNQVNQNRIQLNKINMTVLGSWAVGNIVTSGILRGRTEGQVRYFHEMNVIWNFVNLGLAAGGLYGSLTEDPSQYSLLQTYTEQQKIEKILLFNLALNGTYITAGAWMKERSKSFVNDAVRKDRFLGYGNSLLLQGGFLLVFDLTQFLLHHQQAAPKLRKVLEGITLNADGVGMLWNF